MLVYSSSYSSTVKMEAIYSSETSVDFQRTTSRYILEASTLHIQKYNFTRGSVWAQNLVSYRSVRI
jgi:hypothetical protein